MVPLAVGIAATAGPPGPSPVPSCFPPVHHEPLVEVQQCPTVSNCGHITSCSARAQEVVLMKGKQSAELPELLGYVTDGELVHRGNLALLLAGGDGVQLRLRSSPSALHAPPSQHLPVPLS